MTDTDDNGQGRIECHLYLIPIELYSDSLSGLYSYLLLMCIYNR